MPSDRLPRDDSYLFGDTDLAAERLRLLAEVFAPSTRAFLRKFAAFLPGEVLDLGCGPGHTTRLLAEMFPAAQVCGVDSSRHFIDLARQSPREGVTYELADVTQRVPAGPYDLIYGRYLLTHLPQPDAVIGMWSRSLRPRGRIAVEENEWIHTPQPAFVRYLQIVDAMLADGGNKLYVGAELDRTDFGPSLMKASSELIPIVVADFQAARMFWMNLQNWRGQPFVERNYSTREVDSLERELRSLAHGGSASSSITFGRRRLVFARNHPG